MIRSRPMRLRDIPECVRIVAMHPILAPRYGDDIGNLGAAWRRLLSNEWFFTNDLFEEVDGTRTRTLGVGISVFVTDEFFREAKTRPFFWLGPELARRIMQGRSPLFTK